MTTKELAIIETQRGKIEELENKLKFTESKLHSTERKLQEINDFLGSDKLSTEAYNSLFVLQKLTDKILVISDDGHMLETYDSLHDIVDDFGDSELYIREDQNHLNVYEFGVKEDDYVAFCCNQDFYDYISKTYE